MELAAFPNPEPRTPRPRWTNRGFASLSPSHPTKVNQQRVQRSAGRPEPLLFDSRLLTCATLPIMTLDLDEVRHVARLARLRLSDQELQLYRAQLSSVLDHIAKIGELNVDGVEPMAHPSELTNRLDDDVVDEALPRDVLLALAPEVEDSFLSVPKVLDGEES